MAKKDKYKPGYVLDVVNDEYILLPVTIITGSSPNFSSLRLYYQSAQQRIAIRAATVTYVEPPKPQPRSYSVDDYGVFHFGFAYATRDIAYTDLQGKTHMQKAASTYVPYNCKYAVIENSEEVTLSVPTITREAFNLKNIRFQI